MHLQDIPRPLLALLALSATPAALAPSDAGPLLDPQIAALPAGEYLSQATCADLLASEEVADMILPLSVPARAGLPTDPLSTVLPYAGLSRCCSTPAEPGAWLAPPLTAAEGPQGGQALLCGNILAGGAPPGALQPFFTAAINLGYVMGSIPCFRLGTLSAEEVASTSGRLDLALFGFNAVASCVSADTGSITGLQRRLFGMSPAQLDQEIRRITQDLGQAVGRSSIQCDGDLGALYTAGLNLGFATALSICFPCQQALPPNIVTSIQGAVGVARTSLLTYDAGGCLSSVGYDIAATFGTVMVGGGFAAINTYASLVGVVSNMHIAMANTTCCCRCGLGLTPEPQLSECDLACDNYCKGTGRASGVLGPQGVCMLGQIMGDPAAACSCR